MQTKNPLLAAITGLLMLFLLPACAVNPVSGSREVMLYSPEQEVSMGKKAHPQVLEKFGYYNDPKLQTYISAIGKRLTAHCERQDIPYHFTLIDSSIINAFAIPGGYVYVSRGLLAEMNNEAQLAGVMGHELGHVNARHNMKRLQSAVGMNILVAAVGAATGSSLWQNVSGQLMGLISQKYSRSQERQADELGTRYMARAGYDPRQMSVFLQRLRQLHSHEPSALEAIMASHPLTSERVASTSFLAKKLLSHYPQAKTINQKTYLNAIDGMLFGPGEKAGFIIGKTYTNVFCRLRFSIPEDMKLKSLKNGFVLNSDSQQQLVFLYRELDHYLPPDALADAFMEKYITRLLSEREINIGQRVAMVRKYEVRDKRGIWQRLKITAISRQKFGYLFLALTGQTQKPGYISDNLSLLTRKAAEAIKLPRIEIYQVHKGDTLVRIAERLLDSAANAETLAGYNGLTGKLGLRQPLPVKMKLKIIPAYPRDSRDSSSINRQPSNIIASVLPKTLRSGSLSGVTTWKKPAFQVKTS
ncbi:MAG: M48 family metalloprotease [Deltaproteobacteria bacterium]|nr:M48 family metalloprotease [Deltaproteobacteria bacterium]